ncbi:hypothetical protein FHG12_09675 [Hymenobacter jejuensis]|uniref:TonB C-terminal domain-containing protein n=2 Tax=Hymenobacter jejuensis TaxID=2502781 RepID=A0A5B7ZZW8_9BACT|nr:hypothetical protein FHG12_09675 [Hymenobacter jejuensis]
MKPLYLLLILIGRLTLCLMPVQAQKSIAALTDENQAAVRPKKPLSQAIDGRALYTYVERMPVYKNGGRAGLRAFLNKNFQDLPLAGSTSLAVSFVVDKYGKARNPEFFSESVTVPTSFEQKLTRVFEQIGDFQPGIQHGDPVDVRLIVPITKPAQASR